MVFLKVQNVRTNCMLFTFGEIRKELAEKIVKHLSKWRYYTIAGRKSENLELEAEIISDTQEILEFKKIYKYEAKYSNINKNVYSNTATDLFAVIIGEITYNYYSKLIMNLSIKYYKLGMELQLTLTFDHSKRSPYQEIYNNFEQHYSNVVGVLALQNLIKSGDNFERGILGIIKSYFDTKVYDHILKDIVPKLY